MVTYIYYPIYIQNRWKIYVHTSITWSAKGSLVVRVNLNFTTNIYYENTRDYLVFNAHAVIIYFHLPWIYKYVSQKQNFEEMNGMMEQ